MVIQGSILLCFSLSSKLCHTGYKRCMALAKIILRNAKNSDPEASMLTVVLTFIFTSTLNEDNGAGKRPDKNKSRSQLL